MPDSAMAKRETQSDAQGAGDGKVQTPLLGQDLVDVVGGAPQLNSACVQPPTQRPGSTNVPWTRPVGVARVGRCPSTCFGACCRGPSPAVH